MEYSTTFHMYCLLVLLKSVFFLLSFLSCPQFSKASTRGEEKFHSRMGVIGMQTRCVNCCTRTGARIGISIFVNEGILCIVLPPSVRLMKYCSFSILCISFEMIVLFGSN